MMRMIVLMEISVKHNSKWDTKMDASLCFIPSKGNEGRDRRLIV